MCIHVCHINIYMHAVSASHVTKMEQDVRDKEVEQDVRDGYGPGFAPHSPSKHS